MPRVAFAKYEGLGNDFLVVEASRGAFSERLVRALCDRHFGVGADGVLLLESAEHPEAVARMTVLNADGSRPEMCGNGIRCVALFLSGRNGQEQATVPIETDAGIKVCRVDRGLVEVDMGTLVDHGSIELPIGGRALRLARWSIGNPHAITFEPFGEEQIERIGPVVSRHPTFSQGTNVEFARLADDGGIDLVVWERGVGRTLACGTGACATAAAACADGQRAFGEPIAVRLPGGVLHVTIRKADMTATMRGPARFVFRGEMEIA